MDGESLELDQWWNDQPLDDELEAQMRLDEHYESLADLVHQLTGEDVNGMDEVSYRQAIAYCKHWLRYRLIRRLREIEEIKEIKAFWEKVDEEAPKYEYVTQTFICCVCDNDRELINTDSYFMPFEVRLIWMEPDGTFRRKVMGVYSPRSPRVCKECMALREDNVVQRIDRNGARVVAVMVDRGY